jgi:hypothetical protein
VRALTIERAVRAFAATLACVSIGSALAPNPAGADTPAALIERYAEQAKNADPAFSSFSPERGRAFYLEKHPLRGLGAVSCASCHRKNPREQVRAHRVDILCRACHVINDEEHPDPRSAKKRVLEPFAPSANAERFTDYEQVERFFHTNCRMLLKRECTPQEKGDLIAWLLTIEGDAIRFEERASARDVEPAQ